MTKNENYDYDKSFEVKVIIHWGLVIRTPYNQVDLVIRTGLSPYNQALADLVIRTAKKILVRITRSMI